jgi:hypothetical protein
VRRDLARPGRIRTLPGAARILIDALVLDDDARRRFLGGNARRVCKV